MQGRYTLPKLLLCNAVRYAPGQSPVDANSKASVVISRSLARSGLVQLDAKAPTKAVTGPLKTLFAKKTEINLGRVGVCDKSRPGRGLPRRFCGCTDYSE